MPSAITIVIKNEPGTQYMELRGLRKSKMDKLLEPNTLNVHMLQVVAQTTLIIRMT